MNLHRQHELILKLADGFSEGTDLLLSQEFLGDNKITLDECFSLAEAIADMLRDRVEYERGIGKYFKLGAKQ